MIHSLILSFFLLLFSSCHVRAQAVFAHFMVSNAGNFSISDWESDIKLAQDAHIDAFALNIAYNDPVNSAQLSNAFSAAGDLDFKLFFSFDYAGNGPWLADDVIQLLKQYGSNSAYYHHNDLPFVSTFEGPDSAMDWFIIKMETGGLFFMPDWSSLGAKAAIEIGAGIIDGLFSWAAWPWGDRDSNTFTDASYLQYLNDSGISLPYMMPVSPWFYTNLPGYDKNWLWRGDDLWYNRWQEVLYIQPEFVEIITWNDWGESHYIGPLHDDAYAPFSIGEAEFNYAENMPHDGWRQFLPFVIDTYKSGNAEITQEGVVAWYRLTSSTACETGYTPGNTASELQLEFEPYDVVQDKIFFSALLGSAADVTVSIGGNEQAASWTYIPDGGIGIYHGSVSFTGFTGTVVVTVTRDGSVIAQMSGEEILADCPNTWENWNAWVGYAMSDATISATPALELSDRVCVNGTSLGNFAGLCEFTCQYGYCPVSACTCLAMGALVEPEVTLNINGYPISGEDASYDGLCSYACNHGYCPDTACGTTEVPLTVPTVSDFSPPACIAGTGDGNLAGLCSYACGYGFCPILSCTCTETGVLVTAPDANITISGKAASGLEAREYDSLCDFSCTRTYCPTGACAKVITTTSSTGDNSDWSSLSCSDVNEKSTTQWADAKADDAWNAAIAYWKTSDFEHFTWAMSDFFYGSTLSDMDCFSLSDSNGCAGIVVPCYSNDSAAGYLIMKSFVSLDATLAILNDGFSKAQEDATDMIGMISTTFSKFPDSGPSASDMLFDALGLVYALASGPVWGSIMKGAETEVKDSSETKKLKDGLKEALGDGISIVQDITAVKSGVVEENELSANLENMAAWYKNATDALNSNIFNGSDSNANILYSLIQGGVLLEPLYTTPTDLVVNNDVLQAMYSVLIPQAWQLSTKPVWPVVVNASVTCDSTSIGPDILEEHITSKTASKTMVCNNNVKYYLLATDTSDGYCSKKRTVDNSSNGNEEYTEGPICAPGTFGILPGMSQLDGSTWLTLTIDDVVNGAINTYTSNSNANGGGFATDPSTMIDNILESGNQAPGITTIPVCGAEEAINNWDIYLREGKKSDNYPCN